MTQYPQNWLAVSLSEVIQIQKGKKPFNLGLRDDVRTVPYINIAAFETKKIAEYAPKQDVPACTSSDTLLVWDGARAGLSGRGVEGYLGSTLAKITSDLATPDYLFYFINSKYDELNSRTKGVGIPHIDPTVLKEIQFMLAPFTEQTRIVEKLEELISDLDAGVAELKAAQKKLVQYRQSLLKAAVEGKLTEQWRNNRYAASPQNLTHQERDATASETAANTPLSPRGRGAGGEGAITSGLPHNAWLRDRARELRKAQTPQEQALWQQLRAKRFSGFKFRRQQVIGRYITDFVCFEKKLVIELDGSQHSDTKQVDAQRDRWLNAQGFRVLRFWNSQWQSQQVGVLEAIWQALHEDKPSPPLPNPSPTRGEGLSLTADVDMEGRRGSQPDASFYHDERGAGDAVETGAQLLERILKERRVRWEARQLAKFQEQGKIPPKGWQDKYPEPVKPDTRDLPKLPEGWFFCHLEAFIQSDKTGTKTGPFGSLLKKYEHKKTGVPVIGIENIDHMKFIFGSKIHISPEKAEELRDYDLLPGDIVISRSGTVGEVCVIPDDLGDARFSTNIMRVRLESQVIEPNFFCLLLNGSPYVLSQIRELCSGSTRDFLNTEILKSLIFPVPPILEQTAILDLLKLNLDGVEAQNHALLISLKQSAAQRKNILKAAFSGQLVPQDPNDEPASVLLERIHAERAAKQTVKTPKNRTTRSTS